MLSVASSTTEPQVAYPTVQTRPTPVTIEMVSGERITGHVHLKLGGTQGRVSDLLNNAPTAFIPVTDAVVTSPDGEVRTSGCAIVAREHVALLLAN